MGAPHKYKDHIIQWMFGNKIRIKFPYERHDLWTNSFKIVRQEVKNDYQMELF